MKKVLVLCKRDVYLFCRELNSLQYGENSNWIAPIVFHTKILENNVDQKKSQNATGKVHYTNFHAKFVFILLYIYIQMYYRIYKALNV